MRKLIRNLVWGLVLCLSIGMLAVPASAADTQDLTALLSAGTIKPLGRTQVNAAGDGITADWSGSGFDVNVSGGGTLTVGYKASYSNYWAVLVDGEQIWRGYVASGTGTFSAEIPAGEHTVRVVKETQISTTTSAYSMLTTLAFDGDIMGAPAKKLSTSSLSATPTAAATARWAPIPRASSGWMRNILRPMVSLITPRRNWMRTTQLWPEAESACIRVFLRKKAHGMQLACPVFTKMCPATTVVTVVIALAANRTWWSLSWVLTTASMTPKRQSGPV